MAESLRAPPKGHSRARSRPPIAGTCHGFIVPWWGFSRGTKRDETASTTMIHYGHFYGHYYLFVVISFRPWKFDHLVFSLGGAKNRPTADARERA
jgi:hypothetical protein